MDFLVSLILLIFGILQIILFFKIWGMTNDVARLTQYITSQKYKNSSSVTITTSINNAKPVEEEQPNTQTLGKFSIGQRVVFLETEDQMKIKEFTPDGLYACYQNGGAKFVGNFAENEIADFDEYWEKKKRFS